MKKLQKITKKGKSEEITVSNYFGIVIDKMFIYNKSYLNLEDLLFFGVCRLGILIPELFCLPKNIAKNHLFTPFPASVTAINTKTQKHFSRIKKLSKSKS